MSEVEQLETLFQNYFEEPVSNVCKLPSAGSNRSYYRIKGDSVSAIGVIWPNVEENKAFCYLSEHFRKKELPVPEVYSVQSDFKAYLQQDLGDEILYDSILKMQEGDNFHKSEYFLKRVIEILPKIQFEGADGLDFSYCYPQPAFDRRMISFDLNYFKYSFLKVIGIDFNENWLQDDFDKLTEDLLQYDSNCFMYRDFQARNVMIKDGDPYFIDFQGGRRGPFYYDLASFVWQAKAAYPNDLKNQLVETYRSALETYIHIDKATFDEALRLFVLFRTLQVLGAYGFRGLIEKKSHFIQSIPFAIENLKEHIANPFEKYPYLSQILKQVTEIKQYAHIDDEKGLTVEINSFAYKNGIPVDYSGNGGGYVFDCRSIHNPGKYAKYKNLTGNDAPVIKFLEADGEVFPFLKNVYSLADKHIERFLERGFTHLVFNFGCTGGHHRSVYCANRLAEYVELKYDVTVKLTHTELKR